MVMWQVDKRGRKWRQGNQVGNNCRSPGERWPGPHLQRSLEVTEQKRKWRGVDRWDVSQRLDGVTESKWGTEKWEGVSSLEYWVYIGATMISTCWVWGTCRISKDNMQRIVRNMSLNVRVGVELKGWPWEASARHEDAGSWSNWR